MAVLLNEYKRLQYIIDSLVLPFLKSQHPKWRELILAYLKYLDENASFKAKNITDNVNVNDMYTELLDDFLNLYFKDVVDLNKFGLNDDNKRLFIALSKLIGNLKSTKTSFGFFFNSFTDFSIPSDTGDINVNDLVIELDENSDWWLVNNDPTRPFTYVFRINETELTNLKELIREVHPAGFLQLFLYEVAFEENMNGTDCLELSIHYGALYNAKWNYDAIMEVEGAPAPLLYNGGYTINETHCNDLPIEVSPVIEHDITSDMSGYDQFYPLAGSDQWENPTDGDEWFDLDFGPDDRNFSFAPTITHNITSDISLPIEPLQVYSSDGYIAPLGGESSWATARNAPTSLIAIITDPVYSSISTRVFNTNYYVTRSFLYFDLSGLPGTATVTSAVVSVRAYTANSQVCLLQGTQTGTDNSGLVAGDWNAFTGTPFSVVNWITGSDPRNELTLNAAGLSYIESVAGFTAKFCLREYDSDYLDVAPLDNSANQNNMYFSASTEANWPYITITYDE